MGGLEINVCVHCQVQVFVTLSCGICWELDSHWCSQEIPMYIYTCSHHFYHGSDTEKCYFLQCSLVECCCWFGGNFLCHLREQMDSLQKKKFQTCLFACWIYSSTTNMNAVHSSETLVNFYQTVLCNIPGDIIFIAILSLW